MRQAVVRWIGFAVLATIALLAARMIWPGRQELELDIFVLVLGTFGLIVLASEVRRMAPDADESLLEAALEPEPPEVQPIAELHRLDRELTMGSTRSFDLHYRLRPVLREIAAARLERRGMSLDSGTPDGARGARGEPLGGDRPGPRAAATTGSPRAWPSRSSSEPSRAWSVSR